MATTDQETASTLDRLVKAVSETWNTPLDEPLHRRQRFGYAFAGSISWVFYNFDPYWSNVLASLSGGRLLLAAIVMQLALGAWFAGLISYQDRRCSPSRFFLEGLLFPGVAGALLTAGSPWTWLSGGSP